MSCSDSMASILIVEDDKQQLKIYRSALDSYRLNCVSTASEALASLAQRILERLLSVYKTQVLPHTHIYNFSHTSVRLLLTRAGFTPVFVGLTGWHGRIGSLCNLGGRLLEVASGSRIGFAPSLFVIARSMS